MGQTCPKCGAYHSAKTKNCEICQSPMQSGSSNSGITMAVVVIVVIVIAASIMIAKGTASKGYVGRWEISGMGGSLMISLRSNGQGVMQVQGLMNEVRDITWSSSGSEITLTDDKGNNFATGHLEEGSKDEMRLKFSDGTEGIFVRQKN